MESFVVELDHLDLLAVKGEDSGKFLQGQLTCDVEDAGPGQAQLGAVCNNKGRVLGSFLLVRTPEGYYLEMKPGLLESNKANLDKYIVFYKARTLDASQEFQRLGLVGPEAASLLARFFPALPSGALEMVEHEGHRLIALEPDSPPRYELWLAKAGSAALSEAITAALPVHGFADWELQDLRRGIFHVEVRHIGEFTPQLLSYDLKGFVNFKKGCYTGQEIVARMHYRGSAKKRLFPVRVRAAEPLTTPEAQPVLDADGARVGEILRLLPSGSGLYEGVAQMDTGKLGKGSDYTLGGSQDKPLEVIQW